MFSDDSLPLYSVVNKFSMQNTSKNSTKLRQQQGIITAMKIIYFLSLFANTLALLF